MSNQSTITARLAFNAIDKDTTATLLESKSFNRNSSIGIKSMVFAGHDLLTARERDVLEQIASGSSNKEAGYELGISPRTIEVHRARIMKKFGARNAADLVRIVLSNGRGT